MPNVAGERERARERERERERSGVLLQQRQLKCNESIKAINRDLHAREAREWGAINKFAVRAVREQCVNRAWPVSILFIHNFDAEMSDFQNNICKNFCARYTRGVRMVTARPPREQVATGSRASFLPVDVVIDRLG